MLDCSTILVSRVLREEYPRFGFVEALAGPITILLNAFDNDFSIVPGCLREENDIVCIHNMSNRWCTSTSFNSIYVLESEFFLQNSRKDLLSYYEQICRQGITLSKPPAWLKLVRFFTIDEHFKRNRGNASQYPPNEHTIKTQLAEDILEKIPIHLVISLLEINLYGHLPCFNFSDLKTVNQFLNDDLVFSYLAARDKGRLTRGNKSGK